VLPISCRGLPNGTGGDLSRSRGHVFSMGGFWSCRGPSRLQAIIWTLFLPGVKGHAFFSAPFRCSLPSLVSVDKSPRSISKFST